MKTKISKKYKEILFFYVYWFFICVIALQFRINYLLMALLFLGLPSFYLGYKVKKYDRKLVLEILVFSFVIVGVVDYVATVSNSWIESTMFTLKFLDIVPIETFIWGFLYVFLIVSFYTYYFDRYKSKHFSKRSFNGLLILIFISFIFSFLYILNKSILEVKYFYLQLSIVFLLVIVIGYIKYKLLYKKFITVSLLSFLPALLHEYISVALNHWYFPFGVNVYYTNFFNISIPFEELLWHILVIPVLLILYEYFGDNLKNEQKRNNFS